MVMGGWSMVKGDGTGYKMGPGHGDKHGSVLELGMGMRLGVVSTFFRPVFSLSLIIFFVEVEHGDGLGMGLG